MADDWSSQWSSPVPPWVRRANRRNGKTLSPSTRLLLEHLWSKADSPRKRRAKGLRPTDPVFVYGTWITADELAADLDYGLRTVETHTGILREEGLIRRGESVIDGARKVGLWLCADPADGRFVEPDHTKTTSPITRRNQRVRNGTKPAETSGCENDCPPKPAGRTRRNQRAQPAETSGSLKDKEDPILTRSGPLTTLSKSPTAQQVLIPVEVEPPNPVELLLALHEKLSVDAYKAHGRSSKGRVVGKLPKRSSTVGRRLVSRVRAAFDEHGLEVCEQVLRWRAREWSTDLEQLSRPADQVWAPGAIAFVLGKLDAGLEPRPRGNMSASPRLGLSRGEAPPDEAYRENPFVDANGDFDFDAAMASIDDEYRAQHGDRR